MLTHTPLTFCSSFGLRFFLKNNRNFRNSFVNFSNERSNLYMYLMHEQHDVDLLITFKRVRVRVCVCIFMFDLKLFFSSVHFHQNKFQ